MAFPVDILHQKLLDLGLAALDLGSESRSIVGEDAARNNGSGHAACTAEGDLGWNEHVRHVFVLTKEGKVQEDLYQRLKNIIEDR